MDPVPDTLSAVPAAPGPDEGGNPQDSFGRIETRGIDRVPENERHGRPGELFPVWMSSNIGYLYVLFGGTLSVLGLTVAQSFTVLIAGNLLWALVGLQAITGPASGTPSQVVTRAMYGIRGNRLVGSGIGWLVAVAYEGINLAIGALAGFSLLESLGVQPSTATKIVLTVLLGIGTFALSLYGHATIVRFSLLFTVVLGLCALALGGFVTRHATLHPAGFHPLHGHELWIALSIGFTVIASAPLSWSNGADYSRYLPADTSKAKVALSTAAGGFVPSVIMGGIGILAGTAVDMSDPETTMRALVPGWFYTVFLALIVLSSVTNNVLTAYSSGLYLQALGVRMSRARSVIIDAVIGGALCAYALLAPKFLTSLNNILALTVAVLGPTMAVYAVDIILRRNDYDGLALHQEHPDGPFWYRHGYNPAGILAVAAGTVCALFFVNTTVLVGAAADAMGGIDLSAVIGPLVAVLVYIPLSNIRKETRP